MTIFSFTHKEYWISGDVHRVDPASSEAFVATSETMPGLVGAGATMISATGKFMDGVAAWLADNPDAQNTLIRRVKPTLPRYGRG